MGKIISHALIGIAALLGLTVSPNLSFSAPLVNNGTFIADGGTISIAPVVENRGKLEGTGSITGNITNYGAISPGKPTGTLTVNGDLSLRDAGRINIDINGASQYDQLAVSGIATLDGSLGVNIGGDYTPSNGDSFTVMTFAGKTGSFHTITLPDSHWNLAYGPTSVTLAYDSSPHHILTVTRTGSGIITSNPAGIACGSDCTVSYIEGTPVSLNATPDGSFVFTGWSGACSGIAICQVTMDAAKTVRAIFAGTSIPLSITYQGYLTNAAGQPVDAQPNITFTLYRADNSVVWTETHENVPVTKGIYSVVLGSISPLNALPFNEQYYLGVKVGDDPEMTPKQPLSSVGNAFRSATTDGFRSGAVATESISDGAVSLDKLSNDCTEGQILRRTASGWACGEAP